MTSPEKLATPDSMVALRNAFEHQMRNLGYDNPNDFERRSDGAYVSPTLGRQWAWCVLGFSAGLATQRQGEGEPDGWMLVPIKPTKEILEEIQFQRGQTRDNALLYAGLLAATTSKD